MADIRAAAKALHDSRQALPDELRGEWRSSDRSVLYRPHDHDQWVCPVVDAYNPAGDAPVMAHIARTASPDVTEATEKLLATVAEHDVADDRHEFETCFNDIVNAVEELAAAILREDR